MESLLLLLLLLLDDRHNATMVPIDCLQREGTGISSRGELLFEAHTAAYPQQRAIVIGPTAVKQWFRSNDSVELLEGSVSYHATVSN